MKILQHNILKYTGVIWVLFALMVLLVTVSIRWQDKKDCLFSHSCGNVTLSDGLVFGQSENSRLILKGFLPPFYLDERWRVAVSDIQTGDSLVQMDKLPLILDSTRYEVLRSSAPNEPIRYQFNRPNVGRTAVLIAPFYQPVLVPSNDIGLWYAFLMIAMLGALVALSYLGALLSVLRFGKKHPNIESVLIVFLLVYYVIAAIRCSLLIHVGHSYFVTVESYLFFASMALVLFLSILLSATSATSKIRPLVFGFLAVAALGFGAYYWMNDDFNFISDFFAVITTGLVGVFLADFGWTRFSHQRQVVLKGHSQKWVSLGSLLIGLGLWASAVLHLLLTAQLFEPSTILLLTHLGILLPVSLTIYPIIRIANMRLVITRIVAAIVFLSICSGLFWVFLRWDLIIGALALIPRMILLGFSLIILSYGLIKLYARFERIIDRYISPDQQARYDALQRFISKMPRCKHSNQLIAETEVQLSRYANTSFCFIWTNQMKRADAFDWPEAKLNLLNSQLADSSDCWAAIAPLSTNTVSEELEQSLIQQKIDIVYPIRLSQAVDEGLELFGLVLLGNKKGEGYNLSDIEAFRQVVQQLGLSLDILYLLEREKDLIARKMDLEKQTMEANLRALRAQINPHFLFNTFNSISELIHVAPNQAEVALERLAFIIRYTLKSSKQEMVELGNEMELVKTYLSLEELRFGDRLTTAIEVEPSCNSVLVPALIIQTIVENCIKHGTSKVVRPGHVSIRVAHEGDSIRVLISDNGPGIDLSRVEKGTGLINSIERLNSIYNRHDLLTFQNTGHGTDVTLLIPSITRFHSQTLSVS
jgi:signal transduction histidine kinase